MTVPPAFAGAGFVIISSGIVGGRRACVVFLCVVLSVSQRKPCARVPLVAGYLMAIGYMNVQPISRAEGYSAVASAAYRTRSRMIDERLGQTFDWSRRRDELEHTGLVVPRAARGWLDARRGQSPAALRSQLWNAVEREEKRKDSKVARDCIVAMPWELSPAQRRTLNYWIARFLAERHGFAVEYSAHMPQLNAGEQHADQRNYHTHFMIPTRQLTAQGLGEKTRELDSPKTSGPHIEAWRAGIAALMNRALERAGGWRAHRHAELRAAGHDHKRAMAHGAEGPGAPAPWP